MQATFEDNLTIFPQAKNRKEKQKKHLEMNN